MSLFLAIDGGGTATRAGLYDATGHLLAETVAGPSNPVDHGLAASIATLLAVARDVLAGRDEPLEAVAGGISGAGKGSAAADIAEALFRALQPARVVMSNDLRPVLWANAGTGPGILVVAGTGSCVLAQASEEIQVTAGGWGTFFGDPGSAYQVASSALRAVAAARDGLGPPTALEAALGNPEGGLVRWAATAGKGNVAALAPRVAALAETGDAVAQAILTSQAAALAAQVAAAHRRLALREDLPVFISGAWIEQCALFRTDFETALRREAPGLRPMSAPLSGHRAVLALARTATPPAWAEVYAPTGPLPESLPPTEQAAQGARPLDRMTASEIVQTMNREDARVPSAVAQQDRAIEAAIEAAAQAMRRGGRLIYAGAGTSGRLGVLDASECPPTFGVSTERVVGLIAGGEAALRSSVEGAEDDEERAKTDLASLDPAVSEHDAVVGIAASGSTPYVRAALACAQRRGATTILLCCNPRPEIRADIVIAVDTGPEVLPGSTRLKAGTACKMVLNMISTGAMALSGHVFEGQMVNVRPVNAKLRRRAVRIVAALTGLDATAAGETLDAAGDRVAVAVLMGRLGLDATEAEARLAAAGGGLREALKQGLD